MGFFDKIISATVKTAITPVAIIKDIANVATGQKADATEKHIKSIGDDLDDALF